MEIAGTRNGKKIIRQTDWLFCFGRDIGMITNVMAKMRGKTQINTFQERNISAARHSRCMEKKKRDSSLEKKQPI